MLCKFEKLVYAGRLTLAMLMSAAKPMFDVFADLNPILGLVSSSCLCGGALVCFLEEAIEKHTLYVVYSFSS